MGLCWHKKEKSMDNVEVKVDGDLMTIVVDLSKTVGTTGRGNEVVGTSGNFQKVPEMDGVSFNLMVVRKARK